MGRFQNKAWNYADFTIAGFAPTIPDDAKFDFIIYGVEENTINLDGEISLENSNISYSAAGIIKDVNGMRNILAEYFNYELARSGIRKNLDESKTTPPALRSFLLNTLDSPFVKYVPALGAFASIADAIWGGGRSGQVQPLRFAGKLALNGTMTLQVELASFLIRVPGAKHGGTDNLPFYDKPLGVFSMKTIPKVNYSPHTKKKIKCGNAEIDAPIDFYYRTFKAPEIEFNPELLAIAQVKIEAAYTVQDSLPYFYVDGAFDSYFEIEDFGKQFPREIDDFIEQVLIKHTTCASLSGLDKKARRLAIRITVKPNTPIQGFTPITFVKVYPIQFEEAPNVDVLNLGKKIWESKSDIPGDGALVHSYAPLAGDVNGDGRTDLIFRYQSPQDSLVIVTKFSKGDGTWASQEQKFGEKKIIHQYETLAGDVNGDGRTDLVFRYHSSNGLVLHTKLSNGNGTWASKWQEFSETEIIHQKPAICGNVNADTLADLVFRYQSPNGLVIHTKLSKGDGTWDSHEQQFPEKEIIHQYPAFFGDVNGDERIDLVFRYQSTAGLVLHTKLSKGDGTWNSHEQQFLEKEIIHQRPALTGEVNGDGRLDLIFMYQSLDGFVFHTKLSNGDGTWTTREQTLGDGDYIHQYPAIAGDVNGDGKTDIIFAGQDWEGSGLNLRTKISRGDGSWHPHFQVLGDGPNVHDNPVSVGYVNRDRKTDLIFIGQDWRGPGLNIRTKFSIWGGPPTSVSSKLPGNLPDAFELGSNYPNPFNPTTVIPFKVKQESHVVIEIYNLLGRRVIVLADQFFQAGNHKVQFDATNLTSGVYFLRARMQPRGHGREQYNFTRKMMLLR